MRRKKERPLSTAIPKGIRSGSFFDSCPSLFTEYNISLRMLLVFCRSSPKHETVNTRWTRSDRNFIYIFFPQNLPELDLPTNRGKVCRKTTELDDSVWWPHLTGRSTERSVFVASVTGSGRACWGSEWSYRVVRRGSVCSFRERPWRHL